MSQLNQMSIKFNLSDKIKKAQREDPQMEKIWEKTQKGELKEFCIEDEVLKLRHQLWVPEVGEIKEEIMNEAYCTPYTARLESTKMYQDLWHSL